MGKFSLTEKLMESAMKGSLEKSKVQTDEIDDGFFLAMLGVKRSYTSECVICLSDEMMGTTCGCGHTEIVVFRPCGHSVCVAPCFYQMCQSKNIILNRTEMKTADGRVFKYANENIKDVSTARNFQCPTCRQNVESSFRAEEVFFSPQIFSSPYSEFSLDEFVTILKMKYCY
jgi:hypothetical protein